MTDARDAFTPPPYPYDRVNALARLAEALPGGVVDCSIGTPGDPPPDAVIRALATSGTERGYPLSAGSVALRTAASGWMRRRFSIEVAADNVAACVGTKEFVGTVAQYMNLRDPSRDTVLYPAVSYPTYAMGATLGRCRAVPVAPLDASGNGMDLASIDPADVERALLLWCNSPSNPAGGLTDLAAVAQWGRTHGVPVFSDECYCEFTWSGPPHSILQSGIDGVIALHSLSKRSNLAGVRVGFYAGDPALVDFLRDVRRHVGMMVPGPVQAAAVVALDDDEHVEKQRAVYCERLAYFADALTKAGCPAELPAGGFYLWVGVPDRFADAWVMAEELAKVGGLLVSPGEFYGDVVTDFVRIAVVQPTERLALVAERLAAAGWCQ